MYFSEGSSPPSSDEDFFGHPISHVNPQELNSPDSIAEAILPLVNVQSPARSDIKRHPSPYYYGDLYKTKTDDSPSKSTAPKYKKNFSSDKYEIETSTHKISLNKSLECDLYLNQNLENQKGFTQPIYRKSCSIDSSNFEEFSKCKNLSYKKSSSIDTQHTNFRDANEESGMPTNKLISPCAYLTSENGLDDEMTRQRHVYETAFDCRISKSDDDLDQMDKVSNHPVLLQLNGNKSKYPGSSNENENSQNRRKITVVCPVVNQEDNNSISALSQTMQDMQIKPSEETSIASTAFSLPLRGYTPSPPSTAPLPTKFHGKDSVMNSIKSAPNLPSRLKDLRLPIKSLRGRTPVSSSGSLQTQSSVFDMEFKVKNELLSDFKRRQGQSKSNSKIEKDRILEIKDRPRKELLLLKRSKSSFKDTILEFRDRKKRHKYSSTESITTSSSGGSMESIRSSTSEGNRSTTSSESHHSSSLSSHESDSGATSAFSAPQNTGFLSHANKLHILSPISDKSSQEPISETSDNNRNNNSQKCSPEEIITPENMKTKRRLPQNKNLLNLGFHPGDPEIQGSDSGISIQSREGVKSRFGFTTELSIPSHQDISDLPFDMPKLRRRRVASQDACTSGSATSVDIRDLPFDMPKLRRRLRIQQSNIENSVSQASSSQSVIEVDMQGWLSNVKIVFILY